jgi:hypothetical protein
MIDQETFCLFTSVKTGLKQYHQEFEQGNFHWRYPLSGLEQ